MGIGSFYCGFQAGWPSEGLLFEHPYVAGRDAVDIITTVGSTEADGGATLLVGPTLAIAVSDRCRLVFGGGPVLRATTSRTQAESLEPRSPVLASQRTGYVIRTSLRLGW